MKSFCLLAALAVWLCGCDRAPSTITVETPAAPPPPSKPVKVTASASAEAEVAPAASHDALAEAMALVRAGQLLQARPLLQALVETNPPAAAIAALNEINSQVVFTPMPAPEKTDYTVQPGDTLGKLAKQFNTTIELIKKSNQLTGDTIRVGQRLRIYQGQFAVTVDKAGNTLTVTDAGKFFKRYRVGTGQHSKTPVGEFRITNRIENPPWYRPDGPVVPYGDPANILGTHWLGLDVPGYGIHGTWETNSIGRQSSAGCIRLLNEEVAELYLLLPVGTPVVIHE